MQRKLGHHAALAEAAVRLVVDNSARESSTPSSFAKSSKSKCHFGGIPPRRSHISTAFSDTLNRLAITSAPSRRTISEVALIGDFSGTGCSQGQEHRVPQIGQLRFPPDDTGQKPVKHRQMAVRDIREIRQAATERFRDLMSDMRWSEDRAIKELFNEIGRPLGQTKKSVEHWIGRDGIPLVHIFNISEVFGVDAGWLAGQNHVSKKAAIRDAGLYPREMERIGDRVAVGRPKIKNTTTGKRRPAA